MRFTILIVAFSIVALIMAVARPAGAQDRDLPYRKLVTALTDQFAVPAYHEMAERLGRNAEAIAAYCAAPSREGFDLANAAFKRAIAAWQRVQPIMFGPVMADSRNQRIQFWPDSGGSTARQIRRALAAKDPELLAPGGLEGKSVALQNFSTFERLLVGNAVNLNANGASATDRYACGLMAAIARFQAGIATAIEREWIAPGGFRDQVLRADPRTYAQPYFKSMFGILDAVVKLKLERALGGDIGAARPKRAESWRTGSSLANIAANLRAARDMFALPGGFADVARAADMGPLAGGVIGFFDRAHAKAKSIPVPLAQAVTDPHYRLQVEELLDEAQTLRTLVGGPAADGIGLVVGFAASDGDDT